MRSSSLMYCISNDANCLLLSEITMLCSLWPGGANKSAGCECINVMMTVFWAFDAPLKS